MKIDRSTLREVERMDIVAVMAEHGVKLTGRGAELKGLCPFHEETTPSLSVNRDKGLWHCFGCGAKGNVLGFLKRKAGAGAMHDLVRVAGRASAKKTVQKSDIIPPWPAALHRGEVMARVVDHYQKNLSSNKAAQEYLRGRKLFDPDALRAFRIGFSNGNLIDLAPAKSEVRQALLSLGLLKEDETKPGRLFEHFRGCVVCPVEDSKNGAIIELYGRGIVGKRHLNMSGARAGVWNHVAAKASESRELVVTEGIFDALACWIAGVRNVIPFCGTEGITASHIELFERHRPNRFVLLLDADKGGTESIPRIAEKLCDFGDVFTATLPDGEDPASFFQNGGTREELAAILSAAKPVIAAAEPSASTESALTLSREIATDFHSKTEKDNATVTVRRADREYRIYDLNIFGVSKLRVNLHAVRGERIHIDTLDLFTASPRKAFINAAARALELSAEDVGGDIAEVIRACQAVRAEGANGKSQVKTEIAISDEARAAAIEFLTAPDLLGRVVADITALGYVGEEINKAVGYLVGVSRKLDSPMSGIVLSRSGAGKSQLLAAVATLTPPENLYHFSDLTQNALYYMDKYELVHKLLIIEEREGSANADYSIRELQSRKILVKAVPIKDPASGEIKTRRIEVHGPIAFLESTTNLRINPENASRCFLLFADESPEQTRRVHEVQRAQSGVARIETNGRIDELIAKHHAAQRLLEPVMVINPLAEVIDFPTDQLRSRRDHARFLSLIEAVTFLHQHQRKRKSRIVRGVTVEYIESTLEDYKQAYRLAKVVLSSSLDELPRGSRQLLTAIIEYVKKKSGDDVSFTRRDLRAATKWSVDQVKAYIRPLEEQEYLVVDRSKQGSIWRYRLAIDPEEAKSGAVNLTAIPTPAEVARRMGQK